jgi:hypothetical protein
VKWVEDNLGISRKALRGFEEVGLMPKNTGHRYRDYDEDDIDRIWKIRVFQGMGFTLKEIASMVNDEKFSFDDLIGQKIEELEKEKLKVEMHLGYAKTIKLTGRFPLRPRKMGEMKFEKFQQDALERWNINDDPQEVEYAKLVDTILSKSVEEWEKSDLGRLLFVLKSMVQIDNDSILADYVLPRAIVKRQRLGANHPDIQFLVKLIYESKNLSISNNDKGSTVTKQQFARVYSSFYLSGDISKLVGIDLSEEECIFIAEAVSIFGGYENYEALLEAEQHYGK